MEMERPRHKAGPESAANGHSAALNYASRAACSNAITGGMKVQATTDWAAGVSFSVNTDEPSLSLRNREKIRSSSHRDAHHGDKARQGKAAISDGMFRGVCPKVTRNKNDGSPGTQKGTWIDKGEGMEDMVEKDTLNATRITSVWRYQKKKRWCRATSGDDCGQETEWRIGLVKGLPAGRRGSATLQPATASTVRPFSALAGGGRTRQRPAQNYTTTDPKLN